MDWHNEVLYIVHVILRVSVVCLCLHYPFTFYMSHCGVCTTRFLDVEIQRHFSLCLWLTAGTYSDGEVSE